MTILETNKYVAENAYRQYLQNTINQNATWEIEIQLSVAPVSEFWWVIIEPDSTWNREEVFYHRKAWTSIFTYDVNRSDAKTHGDWSLVVLNNTAWIYNFKEKLNDNIFHHYKISDNDIYIFWWILVDIDGNKYELENFTTEDLWLVNNAVNYIYIWTEDDWLTYQPLVTTTNSNVLFIIKEIEKDPSWTIISIKEWRQSWRWMSTNWWMWKPWNGISSISLINTDWPIKTYRILFDNASYFDYQITDWETIWLPVYTISNGSITRTFNANNLTLHWLADIVYTLIEDIKSWLEAISIPWEDWNDWAPWQDWEDWNDWTDWVWITSIELLSTDWLVKTYRINLSNSTHFDYSVSDWESWAWWDMFKNENLSWLTNYTTARSNLNVYSTDEVDSLISTPVDKKYCMAWLDVTQSINSWTTVALNNFVFQTNDSWMSVNTSRITITKTWTYLIWWQINFAYNTTWQRELIIRKNWSTNIHSTQVAPSTQAWSFTTIPFSRVENLTSWNYIELRAYQTSWSALDAISISSYQYTFFYVKEI